MNTLDSREKELERMAERVAARRDLESLGTPAIKLLREIVAGDSVIRKKAPKAALALEGQGFVFIRNTGDRWTEEVTITAALFGEEALDALDEEVDDEAQEEIIPANKPR